MESPSNTARDLPYFLYFSIFRLVPNPYLIKGADSMGDIAIKVNEAKRRITKAVEEIVRCNEAVVKLQASCEHVWRFVEQFNDHHEHFWNVTYKCVECDVSKTDRRTPPVCEDCDSALIRANNDDKDAESERQKPEHKGFMNPPLAFRCPKCKKIHILWHLGD